MKRSFLRRIFGVWHGMVYEYVDSLPEGQNPAIHITKKLSAVLKNNNFISSVLEFKGRYYVYVQNQLPASQYFVEIANLESTYVELEEDIVENEQETDHSDNEHQEPHSEENN